MDVLSKYYTAILSMLKNLYLIKNILIRKGAIFRIDFKGGIAKKSVYAS